MATKKFFDIAVGEVFIFNSVEYTKISEERISCCKALNAETVSEPKSKIQIVPITEVETKE